MPEIEWQQEIPDFLQCDPDVTGQDFPSALAGEAVTVHAPGDPALAEGVYLTQPAPLLGRIDHDDPAAWGLLRRDAVEPKLSAVIRRIAFTANVPDPDIVGREIDGWTRRLTSWLDILTGQHLTVVGHKPARQFTNRTALFERRGDGTVTHLFTPRGFKPMYKLTEGLATKEILRSAFELAGTGTEVPFPWLLIRDARALHRVAHTRRAVMECGSAAEMANVSLLKAGGIAIPPLATLGTTFNLLKDKLNYPLPTDYKTAFVEVRNREVHMNPGSGYVSEAESSRILEIASALVEDAFPLPSGLKKLW
ncbi:hypothetical protein ACLMAL_26310 [Nocardia sp. CWNU-33]|uniref:hypothetical protein n=1 Tax=Nocardia sp. CWNU-33 TaxID=3392117 RepID=UPI00398F4320